ncbi:MAG: ADP-ribosylglycohydrolase family protein [Calditrichaeota bacterium]|nr:ADP-ribosylglycohydrolase family protein [Calditrichota bacterium]
MTKTPLTDSRIQPDFCNRIYGMLMASAIADAMAGPVEGRSTTVTQNFLKKGN